VQQQKACAAFVDEVVDKKAGAAEQHIGDPANAEEIVGNSISRQQELVFAHVDCFAGRN